MSQGARIKAPLAWDVAGLLMGNLSPWAERLAVGGSLRRLASQHGPHSSAFKRATVGDIEIVACPVWGARVPELEPLQWALIPEAGERPQPPSVNLLWERVDSLGYQPYIKTNRKGLPDRKWGPLYRRLTAPLPGAPINYEGLPVDLFTYKLSSWGPGLAVRTGPADFSKLLMSIRKSKGWAFAEGVVTYLGQPVSLTSEPELFEALQLDWLEPGERSAASLKAAARPYSYTLSPFPSF